MRCFKSSSVCPQGLFLFCLASMVLSAPAPTLDPITAATFTTAGGLVLTSAAANTITIPTAALLAGKAIAIKGLLLKAIATRRG